ncbi:hypothetical protein CBS101457_001828 [Exobasidium rhododendri]|nr:hypothetical protein CBS101457_001828 [Exobasidium rhododendri]
MFSTPTKGTPRRRTAVEVASNSSTTATPIGRSTTPMLSKYSSRRRGDSIVSNKVTHEESDSLQQARSDMRKDKANQEVEEGVVLSRDELHAVTVYCKLPTEVTMTLQTMGPYDPLYCFMDAQTGFAYLLTHSKCFVWSFAGRGLDSPPCFVFLLQESSSSTSSVVSPKLPFCCLIARGGDREPGLLILTHSGEFRYCDNIASSFGGERMSKMSLPLGSGESVSQLHRCGSLFLAATTQSRMFSIGFIASGGTLQAHLSPFSQSRGLFGRLFGTASQSGSSKGIVSIASCLASDNSGAYDVYTLGQSVLQKWSVVEGGSEKLLLEEDLKQILLNQLESGSSTMESFALVDMALTSSGSVAVLYCHAASASDAGGPLNYKVALVESIATSPSLSISSSFSLSYTRFDDSRPYSQPRLLLPYGGPIVFVVFPEAIVIRLLHGQGFEEMVEMRDVAANRIIGIGVEGSDVEGQAGTSNLSIVTAVNGALLVEVDTQRAQELDYQLTYGEDKLQVLTRRLKSKLERGVFHRDELNNPISFDLPQEVGGNLLAAVEQLSEEIVLSQSPGLSTSVDLRIQLANRLEKLHGLATFVASSSKMSLLSPNARRKICSDAELLAAAIDVWESQNDFLGQGIRRETSEDPLYTSINTTMQSLPQEEWEGDLVRMFFRKQLYHFNEVLANLHGNLDQEGESMERTACLIRVNHILLSTFQAAFRYRVETVSLYHLDPTHTSFEAWTCKLSNIHSLRQAFQATFDFLQDRKRFGALTQGKNADGVETASQQQTLKGQLCDLASCTLDVFEERLAFLQAAGAGNPSLDKEGLLLQEEFRQARSQVILSLVDIGRSDRSFYLAEKHRDFHVLTRLCSHSLKGSKQTTQIRAYLEKYKKPFAFELYDFYLQEGNLAELLEEHEEYHDLLSEFLSSKEEYNRIAWLHNLTLKQWAQASQRLQTEAIREVQHVQSKKLMLSLSKLSYVAHLQEHDIASVREQQNIELFDDQLDIINVHEKIREDLQGHTVEEQTNDLGETLQGKTEVLCESSPALTQLYISLATKLVAGAVLSSEDLIDLLSLPDGTDDTIENYTTAIEVFVRAKDIPESRMPEILASLWRRIILHDDWLEVTDTTLAFTSDEVLIAKLRNTALYQTLQSTMGNKATANAILSPVKSLLPPSDESVENRFRGKEAQDMIEKLRLDYDGEVARAREVVEVGESRSWFEDVIRLVKEAHQEEVDEAQIAMDEEDSQFVTMY